MENSSHQFSFRNQKEKNTFGTAIAIFSLTNKIKCKHADYLYTENPERMNQMPAIYTVSCDCQMFQVNFIPSLAPYLKPAIWFFAMFKTIVPFAFCQDDRQITMLLAPGHNHAVFLLPVP